MTATTPGAARQFVGYDAEQAEAFAAAWLPAWTGNEPEQLAAFYTHDTIYTDPHVPAGLRGRNALLAYLRRLLARYPDWVWTQTGSTPMQDGFVNFWRTSVPLNDSEIRFSGVCLVTLRDGLIVRNEVFFDRTLLFEALREARRGAAYPVR